MLIARCCVGRVALLAAALLAPAIGAAQDVTTHHYDNFRTGWDWQETALTQANVNPTYFGLQETVSLDQQIDAQPLVLSNQNVNGVVYGTVVYVATENNSVYAINGLSGSVLAQTHLESAAPISQIGDGSCDNNAAVIGINSTPVIDAAAGTLYVVTATIQTAGTVTYHLHALSTTTLADKVTPLTITPPNGSGSSRQRAALTLFNGGVLIPFTSFCDTAPPMLGFITYANMNVTPAAQTYFQTSYTYLDSIWMSGGGAAVTGNSIYFLTGNGRTGPTSPPATELPHSMVLLTGSPSGTALGLGYSASIAPDPSLIGNGDDDYGSGGVLIVPSGSPTSIGSGTPASFVTGAGKRGQLYAFWPALGINSVIQSLSIGPCWCGESYFTGADGVGRVVTSGGTTLQLNTVNSAPGLTPSISVQLPAKAHGNPGFWTTVSSNQTAGGTGIIWAVSGPDSQGYLSLFAYSADNLSLLFSGLSGFWGSNNATSNTVPVVSNGHVYVVADTEMKIWGLAPGPIPAPVTSIGADFAVECPYVSVGWTASSGATFYNLYYEQNRLPWVPNAGALIYSGPATQQDLGFIAARQPYLFNVAACNSNGCSALAASPASGSSPRPCP